MDTFPNNSIEISIHESDQVKRGFKSIESLYDLECTDEESASIRKIMESKFVALTKEQTRILPSRKK